MSYRFLDPNPVYFELDGTIIAANGSLTFYDLGTTTPKATYNSSALSIANANPVPLNAAGRASVEIWLGGNYTVVLKDDLGGVVWTRDVRDADSGGTAIPTLVSGEFLTNDGVNLQWDAVRQVPDPTGNANKIVGTDGSNIIWVNQQTIPEPDIANTTNSITIGDGTIRYRILTGTGTAPASGGRTSTVAVTFPTAFTATPIFVGVTGTIAVITGVGYSPVCTATGKSTTGFTFNVDVNADQAGANISSPVTFEYVAIGQVAA